MPQANKERALPLPLLLFLLVRIPLLIALPFDGLRGYGDLLHFFNLADIPGLPYIHYWNEFPPGFAFLNEAIYALAGGVEHVYTYLLVLLLFCADAGNVLLFVKLEKLLYPEAAQRIWRSPVYAALIAGLPYAWWYFDSLAIFFALLTLYWVLSNKSAVTAGLALGAGILVKMFPALLLPALLRSQRVRRVVIISVIAIAMTAIPIILLYVVSPEFTRATLAIQSSRGSLQTVWAILDGNYRTGGFGPLVERLDPAYAYVTTRNPPVIDPLIVTAVLGAFGFYLFVKARLTSPMRIIAFTGLTSIIFFLASPSWSPQWVQHLIPIALLVLPFSPGLLVTALLVMLNLVEWPLLLSRGLFATLPLTIGLRFVLMLLLGFLFWKQTKA